MRTGGGGGYLRDIKVGIQKYLVTSAVNLPPPPHHLKHLPQTLVSLPPRLYESSPKPISSSTTLYSDGKYLNKSLNPDLIKITAFKSLCQASSQAHSGNPAWLFLTQTHKRLIFIRREGIPLFNTVSAETMISLERTFM